MMAVVSDGGSAVVRGAHRPATGNAYRDSHGELGPVKLVFNVLMLLASRALTWSRTNCRGHLALRQRVGFCRGGCGHYPHGFRRLRLPAQLGCCAECDQGSTLISGQLYIESGNWARLMPLTPWQVAGTT